MPKTALISSLTCKQSVNKSNAYSPQINQIGRLLNVSGLFCCGVEPLPGHITFSQLVSWRSLPLAYMHR